MFIFFIISIVAVAMANGASHKGLCPEVKPVENFNLTAYQGVWYEISKIPIESEGSGQCAQAEYTLEGDEVKVKNSHVINGVQYFIEGTAQFMDDASTEAKLVVTFMFGDIVSPSDLLILTTDYNGYSIAYNCIYQTNTKSYKEHAWILSRSKKLEGDAKIAVDTFLKDHPKIIYATELVQTDFSEEACKFASSEAMTTPVPVPQP